LQQRWISNDHRIKTVLIVKNCCYGSSVFDGVFQI